MKITFSAWSICNRHAETCYFVGYVVELTASATTERESDAKDEDVKTTTDSWSFFALSVTLNLLAGRVQSRCSQASVHRRQPTVRR